MPQATATPRAPLIHLSSDFIRAKEYLEAIVSSTSDAICTTDVQGRVLYFSPGAEDMLGVKSQDVVGRKAHVMYAGGKAEAEALMAELMSSGSIKNREVAFKRPDGRVVHVSMSASLMRDRHGKVIGTLGISKDISHRVELEKRLRELSITDNLTGLFNQRHLRDRLPHEIERARRQRDKLSMILIDLDGFKKINDQRGHLEGDRILRKFAEVIIKSIRKEVDSAYRYGGDEFVVLLPGISQTRAATVAGRIVGAATAVMGDQGLRFSFGIAGYPPNATAEDFIRAADERMYKMKSLNRSASPKRV